MWPDNSEEMEPDRIRPAILILPGGGYAMTSDREAGASGPAIPGQRLQPYSCCAIRCQPSRYPVALLEAAEAMLPDRAMRISGM